MANIAVIYWTGTGNTEAMANAIVEGIQAAGGEADLFFVTDISAEDAAKYEKLALGCPAMGSEVLEEGDFQPFWDDIQGELNGKAVALFGSYSWADGEWMRSWQSEAEDAGLALVADGLAVYDAPDEEGIAQCKELGEKLVKA